MTTPDVNLQQEVRIVMKNLLRPKTKINVGARKIRTMYKISKLAQIISEMRRYSLDILGISKCRWTGSSCQTINDQLGTKKNT